MMTIETNLVQNYFKQCPTNVEAGESIQLYLATMGLPTIGRYFLYYSNQLFSFFFLSKLIVHSLYIELSFSSINDIVLVSTCRANVLSLSLMLTLMFLLWCKILNAVFSWFDIFVLFSFPLHIGILCRACLERENRIC